MTRLGDRQTRTAGGGAPSVLPGAGPVVIGPADVRAVRELLAGMILPGACDTGSVVSQQTQALWVDLLGELEAVKNTVTAAQARLAVALEVATKAEEARQGVGAVRRGRGVPNQVGLAMQASPHAGGVFLGTARVWLTGMPFTFEALRSGVLSSWRATLLVRETSHLSAQDRARVDEEICGPAALAALAGLGTRRLVARVRELAGRLDVRACVKRNAKAASQRCVSVRPAPDLMVYLTALVPMQQGVQAYARLKAHAEAARATGDGRGVGQVMADTLIERVTGREAGKADGVPVTVNLLVSDQTLLAGGDQPGVVVEGAAAGVGTVPGPVARNLVASGLDADAAWLRAIYVNPQGRLLATTSTSRFHPQGLAALLRAREQGICATSWCDAPVRHIDHVRPHAGGGRTSLGNGQGLCVRCNHAKQAPGWSQKVTEREGRQGVETVAPTGHTYTYVAPAPPEPVHPEQVQPARVEPGSAEPARVQPSRVASTRVRQVSIPPVPEPEPTQPERTRSAQAQPERTRPEPARPVPARDTTPGWTPAVGVSGPRAGRVPRSRYSIGCHTTPRTGTVSYRPPGRRRTPRRRRPADLTWAHTH